MDPLPGEEDSIEGGNSVEQHGSIEEVGWWMVDEKGEDGNAVCLSLS